AVIEFVPNHVSRDYGKGGLVRDAAGGTLGRNDDVSCHRSPDNDFYYYPGQSLVLPSGGRYYENPAKASGNCFSPSPGENDWYETVRLNYCDFHTGTWDKMLQIARYWCLKGVDGFRCDMVEMVPWQFMKWLISKIKDEFPEVIFIAEVYRKDLYRMYIEEVGFDFLYDKTGLYDTLRSVVVDGSTARGITWNWQSLGDLQPRMLNFLENHDERRFASDFFGGDPLRAASSLCVGLMLNDSAYMLYSGQEVGERGMDAEGFSGLDGRTTIFDWWSAGSSRRLYQHIHDCEGLTDREIDTLRLYRETLALASDPRMAGGKTYDLCYCNNGSAGFDPDRCFAFLRGGADGVSLLVCDFSGTDSIVSVRIPQEAFGFFGVNKTETLEVSVSVKAYGYSVLPV
ncbi:MAG: alpha-amylase, partial [Bacteroidales bacterium]|nr:alpha-amylase [Bacteroidales bacterium]